MRFQVEFINDEFWSILDDEIVDRKQLSIIFCSQLYYDLAAYRRVKVKDTNHSYRTVIPVNTDLLERIVRNTEGTKHRMVPRGAKKHGQLELYRSTANGDTW